MKDPLDQNRDMSIQIFQFLMVGTVVARKYRGFVPQERLGLFCQYPETVLARNPCIGFIAPELYLT